MQNFRRHLMLLVLALVCATWNVVESFVQPQAAVMTPMAAAVPTKLSMLPPLLQLEEHVPPPSSLTLSASTVDPTSFLSDIFGSVLGTPLILAIPIVAALAVASLVVFLIVSYANPAESDD